MLGLKRGTVKLAPNDPEWSQSFAEEAKKLQLVFGDFAVAIEHIGSTAIPAILAKPIVDIGIIVPSLKQAINYRDKLKDIGYVMKENDNREERLFFMKGSEELRTHYLHIGEKGSGYVEDMVRFRDFLNNHEEIAKEYSDLKQKLCDAYSDNREHYTEQKKEFVKDVLAKA
jgi:GrpB-like predicted nucleotidyltransferase (UPF0157 family)